VSGSPEVKRRSRSSIKCFIGKSVKGGENPTGKLRVKSREFREKKMTNAECGMMNRLGCGPFFDSEFRIPHSAFKQAGPKLLKMD
jgi:hypothetical protein